MIDDPGAPEPPRPAHAGIAFAYISPWCGSAGRYGHRDPLYLSGIAGPFTGGSGSLEKNHRQLFHRRGIDQDRFRRGPDATSGHVGAVRSGDRRAESGAAVAGGRAAHRLRRERDRVGGRGGRDAGGGLGDRLAERPVSAGLGHGLLYPDAALAVQRPLLLQRRRERHGRRGSGPPLRTDEPVQPRAQPLAVHLRRRPDGGPPARLAGPPALFRDQRRRRPRGDPARRHQLLLRRPAQRAAGDDRRGLAQPAGGDPAPDHRRLPGGGQIGVRAAPGPGLARQPVAAGAPEPQPAPGGLSAAQAAPQRAAGGRGPPHHPPGGAAGALRHAVGSGGGRAGAGAPGGGRGQRQRVAAHRRARRAVAVDLVQLALQPGRLPRQRPAAVRRLPGGLDGDAQPLDPHLHRRPDHRRPVGGAGESLRGAGAPEADPGGRGARRADVAARPRGRRGAPEEQREHGRAGAAGVRDRPDPLPRGDLEPDRAPELAAPLRAGRGQPGAGAPQRAGGARPAGADPRSPPERRPVHGPGRHGPTTTFGGSTQTTQPNQTTGAPSAAPGGTTIPGQPGPGGSFQ